MSKLNSREDTIAAISTPVGEGGIGVIRISGPEALRVADNIFQSNKATKPSEQSSFTAQYGHVVNQTEGKAIKIDEVILLVMKKPKSYTTEDMVEISCHGGRVVMQKILDLCLTQGTRLAEPGEFTKRAFLNGRIDLVQAETVLSLIQAKTDRSYQIAQSHLEGHLSIKVKEYRDEITNILSHIEAHLDFPDDHISPMVYTDLEKRSNRLNIKIQELICSAKTGLILKDGLKVVIAGRTNVGKSSLLNQLAGHDRVLVSSVAGTTRDTVDISVDVNGCQVHFVDTAGIRSSNEPLEAASIQRSREMVKQGDLILFVLDASKKITEDEIDFWNELNHKPIIAVINKSDLLNGTAYQVPKSWQSLSKSIQTSCLTQEGLDVLKDEITAFILNQMPERSDEIWVHSVRQLNLFRRASEHLELSEKAFRDNLSLEFIAADLRLAVDALGEIVGEVVTDDILDQVFSQFCIGK